MAIDRAALAAEIQNDPAGVGYAAFIAAGEMGNLRDAINTPRAGTNVGRSVIPAHEFVNAIDAAEFAAITPELREYFTFVVSAGEVQVGGGAVREATRTAFPNNSASKTALRGLWDRRASRAEFVVGQEVTLEDVVRAVRGKV